MSKASRYFIQLSRDFCQFDFQTALPMSCDDSASEPFQSKISSFVALGELDENLED